MNLFVSCLAPKLCQDNVFVCMFVGMTLHVWSLVCKCVFVCMCVCNPFQPFPLLSFPFAPSQAWEAVVGGISHSRSVCVCVCVCVCVRECV